MELGCQLRVDMIEKPVDSVCVVWLFELIQNLLLFPPVRISALTKT